jgi:hypothetical protein
MYVPDSHTINNFAATNFRMQLRYKYEIGQLSNLYVVYGRGGMADIENPKQSTPDVISDSLHNRDADQILVKLQYRF